MAIGVGRGRICLASFNSPTPKTPCYTQRSRGYLLYKAIAYFVSNFVAMVTRVGRCKLDCHHSIACPQQPLDASIL